MKKKCLLKKLGSFEMKTNMFNRVNYVVKKGRKNVEKRQ